MEPIKISVQQLKEKRRIRRQHLRRMQKKSERIYGTRKFANHLKCCSCSMCGNPRRYSGEKSRQEIIANEEIDQMANDK
jgi:hypothetical protein